MFLDDGKTLTAAVYLNFESFRWLIVLIKGVKFGTKIDNWDWINRADSNYQRDTRCPSKM